MVLRVKVECVKLLDLLEFFEIWIMISLYEFLGYRFNVLKWLK